MMDVLIYGVIVSSILLLYALGFSLVYGVSRIANFAHGSLYVIAGFAIYNIFAWLGINYALSILFSIIIMVGISILIYQFGLARIRGMEISEVILTFAIGIMLLEIIRILGFHGYAYSLPPIWEGKTEILGVPVDFQRIVVLITALSSYLVIWFVLRYTKIGLALWASSQDEHAAMMAGIDSDKMGMLSMVLASIFITFAAVTIIPLGQLTVEAGWEALIYAITVCIVGGLGSIGGVALSSVIIGFSQVIAANYLGTHYQLIVALTAILVTLILRPSGLFGKQKEIEERV